MTREDGKLTEVQLNNVLGALRAFKPDLVIEGATNGRQVLRNLILCTISEIPSDRYVGLDINPDMNFEGGFTRFGNCGKPEVVGKVIEEFGAKRVAFTTYNGLNAILDAHVAPFEKKDMWDITGPRTLAEVAQRFYDFQFHFGMAQWWNTLRWYYRECSQLGMNVYDYGEHDLMVVTRDPIIALPAPAKKLTLEDLS